MAARRRGEDIIDLSMGNPDGPTPPHIVEKLCTVAQREDTHGYSTSRGIPRLRRAISHWYRDRYDVQIDPESEAIVTIGSKEGLAHLMLATLDHGDTILVPNPSYPIHIYGAVIAGAQVRSVPLVPGIDFFNELERAIRESIPKPRMMILGFPSNPTAQCVELDFFERVVALAKQYDVMVVHDLAYADIVYDGWKAPSIMQVPGAKDIAVEFFTLSKSYNMAGWRIGFMVGNPELVSALARIKSYHDYGTFTPLQVAAIAALEGDQQCVRDIARQYQQRRDVLVKGLREAGWMVENPKASMYVWAKIPEPYAHLGSLEFAKKLLQDAKVSVSPGIGFGDYGDDHVRFALIENRDRLRQAVRGIKAMFRADGLLSPQRKVDSLAGDPHVLLQGKTPFSLGKTAFSLASRVLRQYRGLAAPGQADDLVGVLAVAHFHARRADRHARYGGADQVGAFAQLEDVGCRHVAFDELAVDHSGMTGAHAVGHAETALDCAHVCFHMVGDLETVGFEVLDPVLAAAAVGVAVDVDGQRFGGLDQGTVEQGGGQDGQGCEAAHGILLAASECREHTAGTRRHPAGELYPLVTKRCAARRAGLPLGRDGLSQRTRRRGLGLLSLGLPGRSPPVSN